MIASYSEFRRIASLSVRGGLRPGCAKNSETVYVLDLNNWLRWIYCLAAFTSCSENDFLRLTAVKLEVVCRPPMPGYAHINSR